jgi:general secretion pathway protein I
MIKTPFKTQGFTLLEVLIALAILAILMASTIKITANNISNLVYLENKTLAAIIASNHEVAIRLTAAKSESLEGWDQMAGRRWYWTLKRSLSSIKGVLNYRIEVFLEGDKEPLVSLISTMIQNP